MYGNARLLFAACSLRNKGKAPVRHIGKTTKTSKMISLSISESYENLIEGIMKHIFFDVSKNILRFIR